MDEQWFLRGLLIAAALGLAALIARWARRRPNRAKDNPDRVRMPKVVPIIGWIVLVVGALMALVAFTDDVDDPVPMRIASVAMVVGGLMFVIMYRNWYIAPRADEIGYRTIFGRTGVIRYRDIVSYKISTLSAQPMLRVKTASGEKLDVNLRTYDVSPLLAHIDFHRANGRWPVQGELGTAG